MAKLRAQISAIPTSLLARDEITSTVYFDTDELGTEPDYGAIAADLRVGWATHTPQVAGFWGLRVKVYNMADPKPREPRAVSEGEEPSSAAPGPLEVASCLSFYSERNLPRRRGRVFVGPWPASVMDVRPGASVETALRGLAGMLANIGGANVDWCIFSPTSNAYFKVTDWWMDNAWDTQRRRGSDATARIVGVTSE